MRQVHRAGQRLAGVPLDLPDDVLYDHHARRSGHEQRLPADREATHSSSLRRWLGDVRGSLKKLERQGKRHPLLAFESYLMLFFEEKGIDKA